MHFLALAADYDGTLAGDGVVEPSTIAALKTLAKSGRRLLLVTGRRLDDLRAAFPESVLFDRIVAENGAVLFDPESGAEKVLAAPPPAELVEELRGRGVEPLSIGRVVVATHSPHERRALEAIRALGLELQIIFNKGAVMILPAGVNKASGLRSALDELELSPHNVVGVGDAENDHAFLRICGCAAAVANALPMVAANADIRLTKSRGAGVEELVLAICEKDRRLAPQRSGLELGTDAETGETARLMPRSGGVLIAGGSGVGKSTLAIGLAERMAEAKMQFCILDPEGDYSDLDHVIAFGKAAEPPELEPAMKIARTGDRGVVINAQAIELEERPKFFVDLMGRMALDLRRTGRPHWLLVDEAHHFLPGDVPVSDAPPLDLASSILVTTYPGELSAATMRSIEIVIALGRDAGSIIAEFCDVAKIPKPLVTPSAMEKEMLVWRLRSTDAPRRLRLKEPSRTHLRHRRKYAEGKLDEERSFYFRGPDGSMKLRAHNLATFMQLGEGVDDATWQHHLRNGDYARWIGEAVKDAELAKEISLIAASGADAAQTRADVRAALSRRYVIGRSV